jgi:ribose transport system substrate-binding protein
MDSADTGVTFVTAENMESEEVRAVLEPSCDNPPVDQ